jgi:tRNA threonylcarbamoyl adenosine modification protein YjeE
VRRVFLANEAATEAQAKTLATTIEAGDCVTLSGQLGAGKSVFARALMRALGVRDYALPSPSFSLIEEYDAVDSLRIAHMDWYRLSDTDEVMMLGVTDYFQPPWFTIVEWPERAWNLIPSRNTLRIELVSDYNDEHARWLTIKK